jgi:hypothetical protein
MSARRWKGRATVTTYDVAAWLLWVLLTAASLLALCMLLWIVWPS